MAVQDNNQSKQQPTAMASAFATAIPRGASDAPEAAQQQPQQQAGGARQARQLFRFGEIGGSFMRTPMGRSAASEDLTRLQKAMTEQYEVLDKSYEYTLIGLDVTNTTTVPVTVLIVAVRDRATPAHGVAFHGLLLESSIDQPAPRFEQVGGQNIEILRTVGDFNRPALTKVIEEAVAREFPGVRQFNADCEVVPRTFRLEDKDSIFGLASNAAFACATELETHRPDFVDMNLANASKDETLSVRPAFVPQQIPNVVGQPMRSDISIDLVVTQNSQDRDTMDRQGIVSRAGGFLDLVWAPEQPQANQFTPFQAGPVSYQRYVTRFVATHLMMQQASTLPMQLLSLITLLALNEGNSWIQGFRPTSFGHGNQGDIDWNDIGAIGIEVNMDPAAAGQPYGKRINTQGDSFTPANLAQLATATIKPGLIFSLDVEECGPSTWYNGVFAAAAAGNPQANELILNAANYLTNGQLAKYVPQGTRLCTDDNNRIHLGTYQDAHGVERDLRDLGYLQVLNLTGDKDPTIIRDWSDTFNRVDYPLEQRLAARKRIIQGLLPSAKFTGFARRVTFLSEPLNGIARAAMENGLNLRAVTPYTDMHSFERATASIGGVLNTTTQAGGLFHATTYGGQAGAQAGARSFGGRYW
ncbi:hypothetical protein D3C71_78990 [compost metagenome]